MISWPNSNSASKGTERKNKKSYLEYNLSQQAFYSAAVKPLSSGTENDACCLIRVFVYSPPHMICVPEQHKKIEEEQELPIKFCQGIIHFNNDPSFEASYLGTNQAMTDYLILKVTLKIIPIFWLSTFSEPPLLSFSVWNPNRWESLP